MSGLQSAADLRQIHHVGFARGLKWIRCRVHQRTLQNQKSTWHSGGLFGYEKAQKVRQKSPNQSAANFFVFGGLFWQTRVRLYAAVPLQIVRSGSTADWPLVFGPLKKSAEKVRLITVRFKSPLRNSISTRTAFLVRGER